jgi:predicted acetyltransferase
LTGTATLASVAFELRYARPDELPGVFHLDGASFGFQYSDDQIQDAMLDIDPDAVLAAFEGDRLVGASAEVPFELTMPGGRQLDVVGLSWVSVEVTHRRAGIGRALMEQQVRTCADGGVPAIVLTASEAGIYPRYGYGAATTTRTVGIERAAATLARPRTDHGVQRLSTDEARAVLPGLYDRWRRATPGGLDRNEKRWAFHLLDRDYMRHGASGMFHLVHPDGYLSYRVRTESSAIEARNVAVVVDYAPLTRDAHAGLWQVLLGMDLCARIESKRLALDDPLPLLLTNARQVATTALTDGLWVRPLDVAALLSGRSYGTDLEAVLRVHDRLLGDRSYRLAAGADGVSCTPTDSSPDIELDVGDLGALTLGDGGLTRMWRAGRVECADQRLVARLDRAFLGDVAPQFGTYF